MDKKYYLQFLTIPLVLILLTVITLTTYNIASLVEDKNHAIEKSRKEFTEQNKKLIYNKVHETITNIEYTKEQNYKNKKKEIKSKVDNLVKSMNHLYQNGKNKIDEKIIKQQFIDLIKGQNKTAKNNYLFLIDIKTSEALVHKVKHLQNKLLEDKKDKKGIYTFKSKVEILKNKKSSYQELYFAKPSNPTKEYKKMVYFTKFEPFNWIIGTGYYIDDVQNEIEKKIAKKLNNIQKDLDRYIFVSKVHNINGGEEFATILVMPNKTKILGKKISDNIKDIKGNYYRKKYLKDLKSYGESYQQYWFKKPNSDDNGEKLTYFTVYTPFNWIIGSGFYFDDLEKEITLKHKIIEKEIQKKLEHAIIISIIVLIIAGVLLYILINNLAKRMKKQNDKLIHQKKTFKSLYDNSVNAIFLIKDGLFYDCNLSAIKMFKISNKNTIIGANPANISAKFQTNGKDSISEAKYYLNKTIKDGYARFNWQQKRETGEVFEAEVTLTKIIIDEQEIIHASIRDNSEKIKLQNEAYENERMMIQQSKMAAMGEMIGNIAHQWRQPLNALSLNNQKVAYFFNKGTLNKEKLDKNNQKTQELIEYMSNTIDDFRNFFSPNKDKELFNPLDMIEKSKNFVSDSFKKHNITIEINSNCNCKVNGYKNEFSQVILNILNNSKDAIVLNNIENGKVTIDVDCGKKVIINIYNNGGVIKEETLLKVFEPYFTTKEKTNGTGIGLYMSKLIIEKNMHGTISMQNYKDGVKTTILLDTVNCGEKECH